MGFASIFGALAFGFIFVSMVVFAAVIQHNMAEAATEDHGRAELEQYQRDAAIDIVSATYDALGAAEWNENLYADFAQGTTSSTAVQREGTVTLAGTPYSNGTYTSQVIDTGYASTYTSISWESVEPAGTAITFQLRAAGDPGSLAAAAFTGPDGTPATSYTVSGTATNAVLDGNRYLQYRANLTTTDTAQTPQLQSVTIDLSRPVGTTRIEVENTGKEKLDPAATDVYIAGQRIERAVSKRTLALQDGSEQALWNPGESIVLYVARTTTTPATVTVANGPVTDATTI